MSSSTRSNEATTSAAVTGVPSENVTPPRSLNVHCVASSLASHDSASTPSNSPFPDILISGLKIALAATWVPLSMPDAPCGSRFSIGVHTATDSSCGASPAAVEPPPVVVVLQATSPTREKCRGGECRRTTKPYGPHGVPPDLAELVSGSSRAAG
ncbi:hypothetical protein [Nonomuraea salmonea]|uniref:hypothetical protein n=1 Tax=Nonomuraea salmonea TaxID=46181 RepID=UPI0031E9F07F